MTIKKTLQDFKRTHQDNWQDHKQKFSDDQLAVLTDLLVSPSYYAWKKHTYLVIFPRISNDDGPASQKKKYEKKIKFEILKNPCVTLCSFFWYFIIISIYKNIKKEENKKIIKFFFEFISIALCKSFRTESQSIFSKSLFYCIWSGWMHLPKKKSLFFSTFSTFLRISAHCAPKQLLKRPVLWHDLVYNWSLYIKMYTY